MGNNITCKELSEHFSISLNRVWELMLLVSWHDVLIEEDIGVKIVKKIIKKVISESNTKNNIISNVNYGQIKTQ